MHIQSGHGLHCEPNEQNTFKKVSGRLTLVDKFRQRVLEQINSLPNGLVSLKFLKSETRGVISKS